MTRIDEREQQREVREGQREIRERHLVKVADWVAAMICDATKRVRDMERKKAETGSSGSEETDKETENGEKAEAGGGEDGTGRRKTRETGDRWRWTRTERRMKGRRRWVRRRRGL